MTINPGYGDDPITSGGEVWCWPGLLLRLRTLVVSTLDVRVLIHEIKAVACLIARHALNIVP